MSSFATSLIENGTLSKIETVNGRQRVFCNCGKSVFLGGIKKHLKSKYHERHFISSLSSSSEEVSVSTVECDICYESKTEFFTCNTCRNQHCTSCHTRMNRCPFCRSNFPRSFQPPQSPSYSPSGEDWLDERRAIRERNMRVTSMIRLLLDEIAQANGRENESIKKFILYHYLLSEIEYVRVHPRFTRVTISRLHTFCDEGVEWAPEMLRLFQAALN